MLAEAARSWPDHRSNGGPFGAGCSHDTSLVCVMEDTGPDDTLVAQRSEHGRYVMMETVMGNGSSDNVTSRATAPHVPIVPGVGSMRGQKWSEVGSGGKPTITEDEQNLPLLNVDGVPCLMMYQTADVKKSLTSVAKTCDRSSRVIFTRGGAIIQNTDNGHCTPFPRKGDIYTLSMLVDTNVIPTAPFHGRS